jgi:hypothetical protein
MSYIKTSILIFSLIAISRLIPHPPNFTSLIALSFYVPAILGKKYIPISMISFAISDLFIGFHNVIFFTWGSVLIISFLPQLFKNYIFNRLLGSIMGATIFFIITNFGVWLIGHYEYSIEGFILCYTLAIPFYAYTLISTILYAALIETLIKIFSKKLNIELNF